MKKLMTRLLTGVLTLATVFTALPVTQVQAADSVYTHSDGKTGTVVKVTDGGEEASTFEEGWMKADGETAYCIQLGETFQSGYKTRKDATERLSEAQITDVALNLEYVKEYTKKGFTDEQAYLLQQCTVWRRLSVHLGWGYKNTHIAYDEISKSEQDKIYENAKAFAKENKDRYDCGGYIYTGEGQDLGQFWAKLAVGNGKIQKSSSNTTITSDNDCYSLSGAAYGVYSDKGCTKSVATLTTNRAGNNHLTKIIDGKELVTDVNIHVKKGEIYGFLGPNGAGKTTVMKMITNLWKPTKGTVELFGKTLETTSYEVLKRMGSIIEFPTFYEHMSGKDNLQLHCEYMGYYNKGSIDEVLEMLNLREAANKPVKSYSLGMKQRLGIARAILCKPELVVLDEPTNGLDPAGMKQLRDLFKMLCSEYGITLIISSHLLSEIESIADTIGVINHGKMMKEISMKEISEMNTAYIELAATDTKKAAYVLAEKMELNNFKIIDDLKIRIYEVNVTTQEISKELMLNDVEIISINKHTETLEDYFLKMTAEVGK